jgi:hypothetical protein
MALADETARVSDVVGLEKSRALAFLARAGPRMTIPAGSQRTPGERPIRLSISSTMLFSYPLSCACPMKRQGITRSPCQRLTAGAAACQRDPMILAFPAFLDGITGALIPSIDVKQDGKQPRIRTQVPLRAPRSPQGQSLALVEDALPRADQRLTASYFDTPDKYLWRRGLSLRIRRTKQGRVQTLKQEKSSALDRGEWEEQIGQDVPERP